MKIGDRITPKPGAIDAWVHYGKVYEILGLVMQGSQPADPCQLKPPCNHDMHLAKPDELWVIVNGEFGKRATILADCFKQVPDESTKE